MAERHKCPLCGAEAYHALVPVRWINGTLTAFSCQPPPPAVGQGTK